MNFWEDLSHSSRFWRLSHEKVNPKSPRIESISWRNPCSQPWLVRLISNYLAEMTQQGSGRKEFYLFTRQASVGVEFQKNSFKSRVLKEEFMKTGHVSVYSKSFLETLAKATIGRRFKTGENTNDYFDRIFPRIEADTPNKGVAKCF